MAMWKARYWGLVLAAGLLAGCAHGPRQPASPAAPSPHRVVAARYVGILPCADCRGIRTDLQLYADPDGAPAGYDLLQTYLGRPEGDRSFTQSGTWRSARGARQDPQALVIQLDPEQPGRTRAFRQASPRVLRALDVNLLDLPPHLPRSLLRVPDNLPPAAIVLTQGDAGGTVEVPAGQPVVLMLASQPGTGYGWAAVDGSTPQLFEVAQPLHLPDVQGSGFDVFRYEAREPGALSLRFAYRALGNPQAQPVQTVNFQFVVR
ncbi:copper resistance protein NlpE N-terminal domain-containing protein [Caldimonas thermodepolymerans]|uniref:copper resistance protein NlpE N-terminal domain-containing protein n=1 Tax=Caldimonas thermodepolymerans TaxID=215580 RepID=UPI0022366F5B|nr:copper resistance protein NlpE N-terminal domain-containing protein [Caldimonas thermodepolymerans]UZG43414.1 copper resistance protein NlpE N-terminal domain-containing protein [Caldimonas thermodepolymerans]